MQVTLLLRDDLLSRHLLHRGSPRSAGIDFRIRGACATTASLTEDQRRESVVASSSGDHALGAWLA